MYFFIYVIMVIYKSHSNDPGHGLERTRRSSTLYHEDKQTPWYWVPCRQTNPLENRKGWKKNMHQYVERYDRNSQEIFILAVSDLNDVEELATPLTTCGHYVLSRKSAIHEA